MDCATISDESEYSGMSADKHPVQNFGTSKLRKSLKFSLLVEKYQLMPYVCKEINFINHFFKEHEAPYCLRARH